MLGAISSLPRPLHALIHYTRMTTRVLRTPCYWGNKVLYLLLLVGVVAGSIYGVGWLMHAFMYTPFPVYILDTLNLRSFFLPNISCHNCTNFHWSYVRSNVSACKSDEDVFLLILVLSFHANARSRTSIRKSWGSVREYRGKHVKTVFVFGTHSDPNLNGQLAHEEELYGDILMGDFMDSYLNLTMKSIMAFTWATQRCPQAKFILKTDDDSFNHPYRIIDYLLHVKHEPFIGGWCFTVLPDRRVSSKYYVDPAVYPDVYYPTYCAGPGYIMSQGAAQILVRTHHNVIFMPMEDVYIAGMVREAAHIQYTQIPGMIVGGHQTTKCDLATWAKNTHNVWSQSMETMWQRAMEADPRTDCAETHITTTAGIFVGALLWIRILVHVFNSGK